MKKRKGEKKGLVHLLVFCHLNWRYKVDLIDCQSHDVGEHKIVHIYQDHLMKVVILRP